MMPVGLVMFNLTSAPQTDPVDIYRVRDGIYAADMLLTALVHLDLFSWLAGHPATKEEICRALEITDRPTDVMLTLLAAMGLVEERQQVFHLTTLAQEHLVNGSPWYLGPYFASLEDRPVAVDLLEVLRTGKPASQLGQPAEREGLAQRDGDGAVRDTVHGRDGLPRRLSRSGMSPSIRSC